MLPRERDRLLVFLAGELARRRRTRGLKLNQAEAVALISDEVLEAARDGLAYAEVEQRGYDVLSARDVLDGVAELVDRIEIEALFDDGMRLLVLVSPVLSQNPPGPLTDDPPIQWLDDGEPLELTNESQTTIGLTSHLHLFEANRVLRFDRRAAWGMRLALPPGTKVVLSPGQTLRVHVRPIAGNRVVRGHGGLVDGSLDDDGACDRALARARDLGYLGA